MLRVLLLLSFASSAVAGELVHSHSGTLALQLDHVGGDGPTPATLGPAMGYAGFVGQRAGFLGHAQFALPALNPGFDLTLAFANRVVLTPRFSVIIGLGPHISGRFPANSEAVVAFGAGLSVLGSWSLSEHATIGPVVSGSFDALELTRTDATHTKSLFIGLHIGWQRVPAP